MKKSIQISVVFVAALWLGVPNSAIAQSTKSNDSPVVVDGTPHPPNQIMKLLEQSILMYRVEEIPDSSAAELLNEREFPILDGCDYVVEIDGKSELRRDEFSDSALALAELGEKAFYAEKFDKAMDYYKQVLALHPTSAEAMLLVGDVHFAREEYDSATAYFRMSIESNPVGFDAHWFLGDALWYLGDTAGCVRELTIAHVLNVNHESLLEKLKYVRDEIGQPWLEWSFRPVSEVYRDPADSHVVHVQATAKWLAYAMTQALWEFEPGYSEKMTGKPIDGVLYTDIQALELLLGALVSHQMDSSFEMETLMNVVKNGDASALMMYEWIAPRHPELILLLPPELRESMVAFVEKYH